MANTYIEELKEKGLLTGHFGILANNVYKRTRIKNSEILELFIYGSYIEEQSKLDQYEQRIIRDDMDYYYQDGQNEVIKEKNSKKKASIIPDAIFLALLDMQSSNGFNFNQNIQATIQYNAQQLYKQILINIQQQKELEIENNEFQRIINQQQNSKLCINGDKISGLIDSQLIGLNNIAKAEGIKAIDDNAKIRFIAITDGKETDMCHSLDGQVFYIDKENVFDRYYGETQKDLRIERIKCKGLVQGLNLPPISHHFHWCRSTITYNPQYIDRVEFEQEKYVDKKEKMNWQERNETFECKKIKPALHKDKLRGYRINKYQNKIMSLYKNDGNENMCLLDSNTGELVGNITKGRKRTIVGPDRITTMKLLTRKEESVIAIHNHPENYSFSLTDILSYNKIKQFDTMILLTDNYKYYLRKNTMKKYRQEEIIQSYKTIEKEIKKKYNNLNGVEKRDLTNQKFFKKVGWFYEKEKN